MVTSLSSLLVAVVDDDASLRRSLGRLLTSLGVPSEAFAGAQDLLDANHLGEFSCLIVDVHMPGVGGYELAERLFASGSSTPIIFITAQLEPVARLAPHRGVAVLAKPFDESGLAAALTVALGPDWDPTASATSQPN